MECLLKTEAGRIIVKLQNIIDKAQMSNTKEEFSWM